MKHEIEANDENTRIFSQVIYDSVQNSMKKKNPRADDLIQELEGGAT